MEKKHEEKNIDEHGLVEELMTDELEDVSGGDGECTTGMCGTPNQSGGG